MNPFCRQSHSHKLRKTKGGSIAELGASLIFIVPLLITVLFVVFEVAQGYMIQMVLSQSAEQAARKMSLQYGSNPEIDGDKSLQDSMVYNNIRSNGIINNSAQFDEASFVTNTDPRTVTVIVHYMGGQYGLAPFPALDPLHVARGIKLEGKATYRLE